MAKTIQQHFDRRYVNNPYTSKNKADDINTKSPQYPKRMYRPKVIHRDANALPSEKELDMLLAPPEIRKQLEDTPVKPEKYEDPNKLHLRGIELVNRHRYGDDVDILRSVFTKTPEEIENDKFMLIIACRRLCSKIFWSLTHIPKHEKYVLGGDIRASSITILKNSVAIKKRYYRKNLLEYIDIELDVLREYYRLAREVYPEWMTESLLVSVFNSINEVGSLIGGLLKTSVV